MVNCTRCRDAALITISMRIGNRDVVFQRCSKCESNIWQAGQVVLPLSKVVELAEAAYR
jgi:hypothetical protein